ncbi:MAG: hypothetical protein EHM24_05555 [Acidobacteria bacterium]|nr:MAG: hypothetical protein EHM24_05555 [Acidobacteriota bacterium]
MRMSHNGRSLHDGRSLSVIGTALAASALLLSTLGGCALRSPSIADLQHNPGRYFDKRVSVEGEVTSAWGLPLVPYGLYKVADGTGEVTVLSRGGHMPVRGSRVKVSGRVGEMAVLGGRPLGLHIREEDLDYRRR